MTPGQALFAGSIPTDYDTYLGPFLFEPYAADLAARLELEPGAALLETACGTGISTEYLHRSLGARVRIVATDVSDAMLAVARGRRGELDGVRFAPADAADLPFDDASFDAVVCQFGIMFMPDKARAMQEARRVLRPAGKLVLSVWDDHASNPYVAVAQQALASFFESDPPRFLDVPWGYSERATLRDLLAAAGFADVELSTVRILAERPSAHDVARGLVTGNPNVLDVEQRARASVDEVVAGVAAALGASFGQAPFRVPMQAVMVTARR